jgi:uncharacterized membrane protein YfcA
VNYVLLCSVALLASGLTFFSGFGLGTLLLPAFALFVPIEVAVALTAVVHFLNGVFKLALVGKNARLSVALRFGVPALAAAFAGAHVLVWLSQLAPLFRYELGDRQLAVTPIELLLAVLMAVFAALELWPRFKRAAVPAKYLPLGGLLTGFFGGLSGHQGAFRSVFLLRSGLTKHEFIGTGVVIAVAIDVARLVVYGSRLPAAHLDQNLALLVAATLCAFLGAFLGNRLLEKVTMKAVERTVAVMLFVIALGLGSGLL